MKLTRFIPLLAPALATSALAQTTWIGGTSPLFLYSSQVRPKHAREAKISSDDKNGCARPRDTSDDGLTFPAKNGAERF